MENLKKSLEDIHHSIEGKKPEAKAADNYKEIIKAASKQINDLTNGMQSVSQMSDPTEFLQNSQKSMLQLSADLLSRAHEDIELY